MKYTGWAASILILSVIGMYYYQFGTGPAILSKGQDVWGQFGDYFGGVLNPILSFVSVLLLIKSVTLQLSANESILKENKRQESLEKRKSFEFQFYNLIEAQKSGFDDFSLIFPTPNGNVECKKADAVNKLESLILRSTSNGLTGLALTQLLETLDAQSDDKIFAFARRFYLIIKLINNEVIDSNGFDAQDKIMYMETLINLSDFAMVRLICMITVYFKWSNVNYINNSNDFVDVLKSTGLSDYIRSLK